MSLVRISVIALSLNTYPNKIPTKKYNAELVVDADYNKEYGLLDDNDKKQKILMWQQEIRKVTQDPGIVVSKVVDDSVKLILEQAEYKSLQILDKETQLSDGKRVFLSLPLETRLQLDVTQSTENKEPLNPLLQEFSEKLEELSPPLLLKSASAPKMISVNDYYSGKYDDHFHMSYPSSDNEDNSTDE